MKKIFVAIVAFCICISCNDNATSDKGSGMREKNIASSDIVGKAFETGDVSKIDSAVASDFIDHTDMGDKVGPDSLKAMITVMHANFKDMKMEKVKEVADDEYVFSWMRYSGTSDGGMGMPKGPYTMNSIEVVKFNKDGKAIEHWGFMNGVEMMKMMGGQQQSMGEPDKMDTIKSK